MNNTKRLRLIAAIAVFVLVTGCLSISFIYNMRKTVMMKDKEIQTNTNTIKELQLENTKLHQQSDEYNKEMQEMQKQLKDLKQKVDTYERDIQPIKDSGITLSRGGSVNDIGISKIVNTVVTAYTLDECGKSRSSKNYGLTSTGTRARVNYTVAVDPRIIPLGSTIYIPEFASYPNKGIFHAEDTGVRGLFGVDVLVNTSTEANKVGRSVKKVYILK